MSRSAFRQLLIPAILLMGEKVLTNGHRERPISDPPQHGTFSAELAYLLLRVVFAGV